LSFTGIAILPCRVANASITGGKTLVYASRRTRHVVADTSNVMKVADVICGMELITGDWWMLGQNKAGHDEGEGEGD
jgi:hypothetical protein